MTELYFWLGWVSFASLLLSALWILCAWLISQDEPVDEQRELRKGDKL